MSENEVEGVAGAPPVAEDGVVGDELADRGEVGETAAEDASAMAVGSAAADSPVDNALAGLESLADRDLAEHPEVFERIHDELHAALTSIDDA